MATTHGEMRRGNRSKEASIWQAMRQRCFNPKCECFDRYGGRGITVCERWLGPQGLQNFIADMGRKPPNKSLERLDNDGPYSPENCVWATRKEQQRNRRVNHYVTLNGKTLCLVEWAELNGIPIRTIYKRIHKLKWPAERAITEKPVRGRRPKKKTENSNGPIKPAR